jgi:hypothetical protein
MKKEIIVKVVNGEPQYPRIIDDTVRCLECELVKITIEKYRSKRSNPQNRYYWGVIVPHALMAMKDAGNGWLSEKSEEHHQIIHDMLTERFLDNAFEIVLPDGTSKSKNSTKRLNTLQMMDYCDQVRQWLLDVFGYYCPPPETDI